MLDQNFDPFKTLEELAKNQEVLYGNDRQMAMAINQLQDRFDKQQATIDVLIKGLDAANKANELLMKDALDRMMASLSTGQQ